MERYLTILEVSQKQAYIFASNKVKDNIINSAVIAYVLSEEYIEKVLKPQGYTRDNMVYSGGGHTILEFTSRETSCQMVKALTKQIYCDFEGLEVFAATVPYEKKTVGKNLKYLVQTLEQKKSIRASAFKQGSYGIEQPDKNTLKPHCTDKVSEAKKMVEDMEKREAKKEGFYPEHSKIAYEFERLGGKKDDTNFIAVVHIDGNGMGKRVEALYKEIDEKGLSWQEAKEQLRNFSEGIDKDFKDSYREMVDEVSACLESEELKKELDLEDGYFPIRHIITAGDDISFVTEGRIGLECARIFIEKLTQKDRKNKVDHANYAACAGVCLVHCKYPFFKAYQLAEMLCSNAKAYGAQISPEDNGSGISSIDWHVEFGELQDTLAEVRSEYVAGDGTVLYLRPYVITGICGEAEKQIPQAKKYTNFRGTIRAIQHCEQEYGIGKVKELRSALKKGKKASENYLYFNKMEQFLEKVGSRDLNLNLDRLFSGAEDQIPYYVTLQENGVQKEHSIVFDAIELMDTYLALDHQKGRD